MKRFLILILIFFGVVIAADFIFGKIAFYAEYKSSSKNYHCMYEADEDILILGSSYAVRNIVPSVIEDSLGVSCFNAGEAGNGAIVAWARYNMFIKNHIPKLIIYTLTPEYDYVKSDDYSKYLNAVKPYFGKDESVVEMYDNLMGRTEALKLNSNFVKFNSYVAQLVYHWLSKKNIGLQGYEPLNETFIPYEIDDNNSEIETEYKIDIHKMNYLERLFNDIKERGILMICVMPPDYRKKINMSQYELGIQLCEKYEIPIVNHKYYEGISQRAQYFYDISHLNDSGARLYSGILAKEISNVIEQ